MIVIDETVCAPGKTNRPLVVELLGIKHHHATGAATATAALLKSSIASLG